MKKILPYFLVVLVLGVAAFFYFKKHGNNLVTSTPETTLTKSTTSQFKTVDACTVVTQADAVAILGNGAKKSETVEGDTSSEDILVSTCSYSQSGSVKALTLLARSAKSNQGADSNSSQFTSLLPEMAQKIDGFGDNAYWDPTYGQLNILKNNNWYILTIGGLRPADKSLEEAKKFAVQIEPRL